METTNRGFPIKKFKDQYGLGCSIQKSSLAFVDCIWLGIDDPKPVMFATPEEGYPQLDGCKVWVKYPLPEDVQISTRMHLTQEQVKELLPYLIKFTETGELE